MTIRIILLLIVFTRFGLAQTIQETLIVGLLQGASQIDFNGHPPEPVFHDGLMIINSDTVKGQIKVSWGKVYFFNDSVKKTFKNHSFIRKASGIIFYPFVRNNPKQNSIKSKKITSLRLFAADTLITKNGYTDFIHIGTSSHLFRKIYSGSLEIYDYNNTTNESPGYIAEQLIVLDNGKMIEGISSETSAKKFLIKCINNKFNKNFVKTDFRHMVDIIKWLNHNDVTLVDSKNPKD